MGNTSKIPSLGFVGGSFSLTPQQHLLASLCTLPMPNFYILYLGMDVLYSHALSPVVMVSSQNIPPPSLPGEFHSS